MTGPQYGVGQQPPVHPWQQAPQHPNAHLHHGQSAPPPVPPRQPAPPPPQQPKTDWTYGLPPGVRPDLLAAPLGQHGAMAGGQWNARGSKATGFLTLVIVELRKLFGTRSDRLMLALAPVVIGLMTWFGTSTVVDPNSGAFPTTAAEQIFGLVLACELGQIPVYTVVLKTFCGEWHYRSIQLTLLLQPRRWRYALAQVTSVLLLWVALALTQFAIYVPLMRIALSDGRYQDYLGPRMGWALGAALLASLIGLVLALCVAFLVPNPTAAMTTYLALAGLIYFRTFFNDVLGWVRYIDPWQVVGLYAEGTSTFWPSVTSGCLLLIALAVGMVMVARRDAR